MESFQNFAQKCSNDGIGSTLTFLLQDKICFTDFHMGRVNGIEDLGAKVNQCS